MSIRNKLLIALLVFGGIAALIGYYAMSEVRHAVGRTVQTYNRPFLSMNYARSAYTSFIRMQNMIARLELRGASVDRDEWLAKMDGGFRHVRADLNEAFDHAPSDQTAETIRSIITELAEWHSQCKRLAQGSHSIAGWAPLYRASEQISLDFDYLFDLISGEGFRLRQESKRSIAHLRQSAIFVVAMLILVAAIVGTLLGRAVTKPVTYAVAAAERIARGELSEEIEETGSGEMSLLLKSMSRMQRNLRDIMAREEELRKSTQMRLADAIENSPEGIILLGPDFRIVIANSRVRDLFGDAADNFEAGEEFLAGVWDASVRGLIPNSDAIRLQLCCRKAVEEGQAFTDIQTATDHWLRFQFSRAGDGGTVVICTDITDIIRREQQLKEAKEVAEAANLAKTEFLANMSHELRTPLNAVIGFSQILKDELLGPVGCDQYLQYSGDIYESGSHLLSIINEILDLSKIEAGKMEPHLVGLDTRKCIEATLRVVRPRADDAGIRLEAELDDVPEEIVADERLLKQMLLNVLSNAVKFTDAGGSVTVRTETLGHDRFRIGVIDTGIGMTEEEIRIAGEPFGQVESAFARKYDGTGLGLPLSRRMAELHGGTLTIESEPGVGTCVTLELPVAQPVRADMDEDIGGLAQAV